MKHIYLLISALLYVIIFFILFPYNRYNIDADGIAYIQAARQYAGGNYFAGLNGCWSPLLSWILVPFIKLGCDPVLCCKYINGVLGICSLFSFYILIQKFCISAKINVFVPFILLVFTLSSAFKLLGPDGLQTFLLSIYINLICSRAFIYSNRRMILCGVVGALCYYAKAYNFFFFIINISVVLFILSRNVRPGKFYKFYILKMSVVFIVFVILTSPYIILLSNKYDKFTVSTASLITINKSLEPSYTDGKKIIVPPPYSNGLAISDDPTFFQNNYITPFTSTKYLCKQIKITAWNILDYFRLLTGISIFSITILVAFSVYLYFFKQEQHLNEVILLFTAIMYPAGYLLIALEWRYIWIIPVLLLLMACIVLSKLFLICRQKNLLQSVAIIVLLSFCIMPIKEMKENIGNKTEIYKAAFALQQNGINGNFIAPNDNYRYNNRNYFFCYLLNIKLFGIYTSDYTTAEIFDAARKYKVKYFFQYYNSIGEKENILRSELLSKSIKYYDSIYPGIIVAQLF